MAVLPGLMEKKKNCFLGKVFEIKGVSTPCATLLGIPLTVDNCKVIIDNLQLIGNKRKEIL